MSDSLDDPRSLAQIEVHPFGDRAWLIELGGQAPEGWVPEAAARLRARWPDALLVPGLASVLLARAATWDGPATLPAGGAGSHPPQPAASDPAVSPAWPASVDDVLAALAAPQASALQQTRRPMHVLAARYDGPDLAIAAAAADVSPAELIARHRAAQWTVAAVGFSPGFGYLTCSDPVFARIGRRADPRARVPAGSIALAAGLCAVYPSATPGGWQLVGTTDAVLWDPACIPPARLGVGDQVRFASP